MHDFNSLLWFRSFKENIFYVSHLSFSDIYWICYFCFNYCWSFRTSHWRSFIYIVLLSLNFHFFVYVVLADMVVLSPILMANHFVISYIFIYCFGWSCSSYKLNLLVLLTTFFFFDLYKYVLFICIAAGIVVLCNQFPFCHIYCSFKLLNSWELQKSWKSDECFSNVSHIGSTFIFVVATEATDYKCMFSLYCLFFFFSVAAEIVAFSADDILFLAYVLLSWWRSRYWNPRSFADYGLFLSHLSVYADLLLFQSLPRS